MLHSGQLGDESYIWSLLQMEMMPIAEWQTRLHELLETHRRMVCDPVWRVRHNSSEFGPLTQEKLLMYMMTVEDLSAMQLCYRDEPTWRDIFEFSELLEKVGLAGRKHHRTHFLGEVDISCEGRPLTTCPTVTLSLQGIGLRSPEDLKNGENVQLKITSPSFEKEMLVDAQVLYTGSDGVTGLKFVNIKKQDQGRIFTYLYSQLKGLPEFKRNLGLNSA